MSNFAVRREAVTSDLRDPWPPCTPAPNPNQLERACLDVHYGVVLREERYLDRRFGEAYRQYMADVPRYGWPFASVSKP